MKRHLKLFVNPFLADRKFDILLAICIIILGCMLFLFEYWRNPKVVHLGTMWYFILLSVVLLIVWNIFKFLRHLPYYQSMEKALESDSLLEVVYLIDEERTNEQHNAKQLMLNLQSIYATQLNEINQQQDVRYQFTMQWVHQMKTPLTIIDMQLQQAKLEINIQDEYVNQLLASIAEETVKLEQGLNMMLHTARLDKFEIDLNVRSVSLDKLARDVINGYKKMCIQYRIFPKVVGEGIVESDSKWLSFVLQQIIGNAIKYSKLKDGAKTLLVMIEKHDHSTELSIHDEGIGIEEQDIRRVFAPFFTGQNGRITGESTGMGLYLSEQICKRLGHPISITSQKDIGTTVKLTFQSQTLHKL